MILGLPWNFVEYRKRYHEIHKDEIKARKKKYYSDPDNAARKAERNKELYKLNKDKVSSRQLNRRQDRKSFIDRIALYYDCQNPDCKWDGEYQPCQLDFHHFNPDDKIKEVSRMHSCSYDKIIAEIDKCIVVCRNCHPLVHNGSVVLTEAMLCKSKDYLKVINEELLVE
jgi:hypothetical protein